jgi:hypothetical protein
MKLINTLFIFFPVVFAIGVYAIDHKNLDENRPLLLEDAYAIAHGEWVLESGAAYNVEREGSNRGEFPLEILYGALPNLQLGLGTELTTSPHQVDEQAKSGDLNLSALYNLNQETLTCPAFGFKFESNFPTGIDSSGVDFKLKGLMTKSFDRFSTHFNAAYEFLNGTAAGERDGRYEFLFGASYPIGAPKYTRTIILGDLIAKESVRGGDENIFGAEVGFRHQLTARTVFDLGIGSEFAGSSDRSDFYVKAGISIGF